MATIIIDGERHEVDAEDLVLVDQAPSVPNSVTPRQLKLALLASGDLDRIEAFVASPAVPRDAQISWNNAIEYRRDDMMLNSMAAVLDPPMSPEQIDNIFRAAAEL